MTAITATGPGRARTMTPARALRHALTLAWRSLVRIRRNPEQLLDVTLQPIVFVTLFVFLFGGAIKGESRHTYLQYVLPGIMVMTVVFASMGTGIGLNTDVTKGIFDRFRSLPISRSAPLTGTIMGDFFRYLVSVAMVFGYGSLLGFRIATNPLSALGAAGLMFVLGFAVGWIWVLLGLYVKSPQSLQGFGFIVMFPLAFGSNVFIQATTLPGWLQAWVRVTPDPRLQPAGQGAGLDEHVAPEREREHDDEPEPLQALRGLHVQAEEHPDPADGKAEDEHQSRRAERGQRISGDPETEQRPVPEDHRDRDEVAEEISHDRLGQRGRPGYGQAPEPVEDPLGDVGVQPDAGAHAREHHRHHHDAGQHVLQVGVPALALDRAAEQEHEQRHEDDRLQRDVEQLLGVAPDPHERAPGQRERVPQRAGR